MAQGGRGGAVREGYVEKYGKRFPAGTKDLDIELWCYAHDTREEGERGRLTKWDHFKNAVDLLWNNGKSPRRVIWNRWTVRMLRAMIYEKYVGLAGAGSSGKSDSAAIFAIVDWLSAPTETMFLVCSTTLEGARGRIWKSITELWNALESQWEGEGLSLPGRMVQSKGRIMGMDNTGKWSSSVGIWLIAAGKDDEIAADKKLKGLKAPSTENIEVGGRLRLIADEFSDLGMCVYHAMMGNLSSNEDFKGIGMANPGSKLTPFGKFVEPLAGWNSLVVGMEEWRTKAGICLSFDSLNSPRMTEVDGDRKYPWMQSKSDIERMRSVFGEDSVEFWAQVRGMFCPTGMERTVWSEIELLNAKAQVLPDQWDAPPDKKAIGLDPGFTTDGDRSPLIWAEFGTIKGVKTMNILGFKVCSEVPMTVEGQELITPSEHVIDQFRDTAAFLNIPAKRCGYDATGGGTVFGQWLRTKWSSDVIGVRFGEAPVERRADSNEEGELIYANRVTQLWVQPKALVRQGQIRGIPEEVIEELCQRKYDLKKNAGSKTCVEKKADMKKRTGKSPDLADAFVILVEVAIQNGLIDVQEIRINDRRTQQAWKHTVAVGLKQGPRKSIVAMPMTKRLRRT